jgi:hypothetical protein
MRIYSRAISETCSVAPLLNNFVQLSQFWSMWQQATKSVHLHPILLHKADGKRIVLEAAQKDSKVSAGAPN